MLIEAARRAEDAAKDMLTLADDGSASCDELREMLAIARRAVAMISAAQTSAAATISRRERHGDRGAQVLADSAGLTRRDAHSQITTAETLRAVPAARDAVESGRVPQANARRLAEAITKTDAAAVEAAPGLLAKAETMRPDQFTREARRWTAQRQADGGDADYHKMRSKRSVRFFDGEDGMVHLHGEFDPVTGRRIANRLHHHARWLHTADQHNLAKAQRRRFPQCLADALDDLTATGLPADAPDSGSTVGSSESGCCGASADSTNARDTAAGSSEIGCCGGAPGDAAVRGPRRPLADICVVAHVDEDSGRLIGELPDGSRLPSSVLDELTCNATVTGVIFDRTGRPIWQTTAGRDATAVQRRILKARWGGCFHCGANFAICQPHHINPVSQGGQTRIENLVPACWGCHQLIHRDGWQIHKSPDGHHTLHPPKRIHYGPPHAPEGLSPIIAAPQPMLAHPCEPEARHGTPTLFTDPQPPTPTPDTETAQAEPGPQAPNGHNPPAAANTGTGRAGPRPEPHTPGQPPRPRHPSEPHTPGQPPRPRPGPASARSALQAARAAQQPAPGPTADTGDRFPQLGEQHDRAAIEITAACERRLASSV